MAKLALVYGMRLLPAEEIEQVGEAEVRLKSGKTAHVTMHLIEGGKRKFARNWSSRWTPFSSFIRKSERSYSCAGIWESESFQALSFKRRHTQHKLSVELGAHSPPHTTQGTGLRMRSASMARLAGSRMTSGTIASGTAAGRGRAAEVRLRFTL